MPIDEICGLRIEFYRAFDFWGACLCVDAPVCLCVSESVWCACTQHSVVTGLIHWLQKNAHWQGTQYTDTTIPAEFQPEDCEPTRCADTNLLRARGTP